MTHVSRRRQAARPATLGWAHGEKRSLSVGTRRLNLFECCVWRHVSCGVKFGGGAAARLSKVKEALRVDAWFYEFTSREKSVLRQHLSRLLGNDGAKYSRSFECLTHAFAMQLPVLQNSSSLDRGPRLSWTLSEHGESAATPWNSYVNKGDAFVGVKRHSFGSFLAPWRCWKLENKLAVDS